MGEAAFIISLGERILFAEKVFGILAEPTHSPSLRVQGLIVQGFLNNNLEGSLRGAEELLAAMMVGHQHVGPKLFKGFRKYFQDLGNGQ